MPVVRTVLGMVETRPTDAAGFLYWDGGAELSWSGPSARRNRPSRSLARARVAVHVPIAAWFSDAAEIAEAIDPEELEDQWKRALASRPRKAPFDSADRTDSDDR